MGPCPRGIVEDVTAQGWWEIIAGHNNRYQENRSGGFLYGHNNRNLVWLCKVSQIHSANILFGHARAHREANGCTRLQTHGLANTRHGLTRVNYVTVSLESPPQSWQITLSTGCPTLGGCYDSVSSDEERGTSPTWNHWTRVRLLLSCYRAALFHYALWGFCRGGCCRTKFVSGDFNQAGWSFSFCFFFFWARLVSFWARRAPVI